LAVETYLPLDGLALAAASEGFGGGCCGLGALL
jgi:hypothetical protein